MAKRRPKTREYLKNDKHRVAQLTADDTVIFRSVRGHDDIFSMRNEAIEAALELLTHYGKNNILKADQVKQLKKIAYEVDIYDIDAAHAKIEKEE